ncbi:uncharacterized protein [Nicotiana sylvestris]|uniref:uncharacterized protein n=1 Tax=Nicotiana sylvestris TaxID=4096 RepID=UPI00388C818F
MWYVLKDQDSLESINHVMSHTEEVVDDLIYEYEQYLTAQAMWARLREAYGGTTVTRLRQLTIKFNTYKKRHDHGVKQHLRQIQAMIRSLPNNWEHLKVNLTHNDSIKTFADVARHVELEDERLGASKIVPNAFVEESSGTKRSSFKRKRNWKNDGKGKETGEGSSKKRNKPNSKKGKRFYKKKGKSKMKCYNCQVPGHFAHLGAIDHVSRDREVFIQFRRVSPGSKHVYVRNNAKLEVKGIVTCRMDMCGGRSLMLHDVLYVSEIRRNLVSLSFLLDLDFNLNFSCNGLRITQDNVFYGFGHRYDSFIVLDCNASTYNYYVDRCVIACYSSNNDVDVITWHARLGHIGQD